MIQDEHSRVTRYDKRSLFSNRQMKKQQEFYFLVPEVLIYPHKQRRRVTHDTLILIKEATKVEGRKQTQKSSSVRKKSVLKEAGFSFFSCLNEEQSLPRTEEAIDSQELFLRHDKNTKGREDDYISSSDVSVLCINLNHEFHLQFLYLSLRGKCNIRFSSCSLLLFRVS